MPWIEVIPLEKAKGFLKKEYEAALERAGRIWHIVSIMSQNPRSMKASMDFYSAIMFGKSPLSRSQREMLAVIVSATNHCLYWIRAHAHDLRAEVANDWGLTDEAEADRVVHLIASNWQMAPLAPVDRALCAYAEKLTQTPQKMAESDLEALRQLGLDDRAIHDATQVISYFNYINRIADSLHVEPEDFIRPWEKQQTPNSTIPIRQRLKTDLMQAMKARQKHIVSTLRSTLAEIDNAEAVEIDTSVVPLVGRTHDVPRKELTEAQIRAIVQREANQIKMALTEYERVGQAEKTAELQAAWELLTGYLVDGAQG